LTDSRIVRGLSSMFQLCPYVGRRQKMHIYQPLTIPGRNQPCKPVAEVRARDWGGVEGCDQQAR